jgi:hypothetical protein
MDGMTIDDYLAMEEEQMMEEPDWEEEAAIDAPLPAPQIAGNTPSTHEQAFHGNLESTARDQANIANNGAAKFDSGR